MPKLFTVASLLLLSSLTWYANTMAEEPVNNPLLSEFPTPFGAPPFDAIQTDHYMPAILAGIEAQLAEVDAITANPDPPTFSNTVEALERSGQMLARIRGVFFNLNSAHTNEALQALAKQINPRLARHRDDIYMNPDLFARVQAVHQQRDRLELAPEQRRLIDEIYRDFVRGGANLAGEAKIRFREINAELSLLATQFEENLLKEMNQIALLLEDEEDLAGLPQSVRDSAAATAAAEGHAGHWGFTLQRTSWTPFLQFSERRELRKELYTAYMNLCNHGNDLDNKAIAVRMAALRAERAELLGYPTHAHYVLEENMAQTPDQVYELLNKLWELALASVKNDRDRLQTMVANEGGTFQLAPWDWWFYAEKLRKAEYDFDEQTVRPYFELARVQEAAYDVAEKLWGITVQQRNDVPVYHPDVRAYEVKDSDGTHLALFYTDYFTRDSKQGGAWMNNYREQWRQDGQDIRPIVVNVCNFTKPVAGQSALLSLDEARTLFHEFGHALHGILAKGTYVSLSGTNVPRDFVELPSQMMENWALAPEVLPTYARHYQTGEPIPDTLVKKLEKSKQFNQAFALTEYLAASLLDMDWHTLTGPLPTHPLVFEANVADRIGLIPEIIFRYRTPYFAHIFAGEYAAGYYSYIWAEVLDADAFEAFQEKGIYDPGLAHAYRKYILEAGHSAPPMELYRQFRGAEPKIDALLKRKGLVPESTGK